MRAVGTGKHPEGRFPKGQVCDLPAALDGSGDVHPDYQSFIDKGWLDLVKPEDDPGRTTTQIANSIVRGDALSHPVDAKLADEIDEQQAHAIVHTGDPKAKGAEADPHDAAKSRVGTRGVQLQPSPRGHQPGGDQDTGYAGGTGSGRDSVSRGGGSGDRGTAAEGRGAQAREGGASTGGGKTGAGGSETGTGQGEGASATLPGADKAKQPTGGTQTGGHASASKAKT